MRKLEVKEDWHLDKGLSISHLIATIMLVMGGVSAYFGVTERISLLEVRFAEISDRVVRVLEAQQRVDDSQDRDILSFRNEVRSDIREINAKLDRLIEGLSNRQ